MDGVTGAGLVIDGELVDRLVDRLVEIDRPETAMGADWIRWEG